MFEQVKVILFGVFAFIVFFNINAGKVQAAVDASLLFDQSDVSASVGQTITLIAKINPGTNEVGGVELDINFDPNILRLESVAKSDNFNITLSSATINNTNGTSSIDLGLLTDPATYITGNSDVAIFIFRALSSTDSTSVSFAETSNASAHGEYVVASRIPTQIIVVADSENDIIAPVVINFTIPATSSSLNISIINFAAADAVGVTGYKLTENSSRPSVEDSGWSVVVPSNYTFSSAGEKTLYAWAKDAAGNISESLSDSVTITLPTDIDDVSPIVSEFDISASSSSLIVSVNNFTATDNVGVVGYKLTETPIKPVASESGWNTEVPTSYTFLLSGRKTLYAWAKDAAGNVSESLSDSVEINLSDILAPTITSFNIPSNSSSLTVPITSFVAQDDVEITGYILKEESATPSVEDDDWSKNAPSSYTFSLAGVKTLYAWAKDAAGNVSESLSDSVEIVIDNIVDENNDKGDLDLSGGEPSGVLSRDTTAVNLSLKTNKNATCRFSADDNISYDSMSIEFTTTGKTEHSYKIEGVKEGGEYKYYVKCKDESGNISQNDYVIAFSIKDKDSVKEEEKTKRKITNSQSSIKIGQILVQKGKRFSKNAEVLLYFSKADGSYYPPVKVKTNSEGKFEVTYKVNKPKGKYTWYAVDTKTGRKSKIKDYLIK